jgi:hypothetical protein
MYDSVKRFEPTVSSAATLVPTTQHARSVMHHWRHLLEAQRFASGNAKEEKRIVNESQEQSGIMIYFLHSVLSGGVYAY